MDGSNKASTVYSYTYHMKTTVTIVTAAITITINNNTTNYNKSNFINVLKQLYKVDFVFY